jgi:methylase of polypeptide subunit release factors
MTLSPTLPNRDTTALESYSFDEVFFCPEESQFYSQCLEKMVLNRCTETDIAIEFGSGEGSPVISSLLKTSFCGKIYGYELNSTACQLAKSRISQYRLNNKYEVRNQCFFEGYQQVNANYLIANPPYLPAPDNDICMPALHGGADGAAITKRLFTVGCDRVLSLISAYSNPVETIEYAIEQGYEVIDFMISPLKFGYYSSEDKVRDTISALKSDRKAFYSPNVYLLAGVLFEKQNQLQAQDTSHLSTELLQVMTAL